MGTDLFYIGAGVVIFLVAIAGLNYQRLLRGANSRADALEERLNSSFVFLDVRRLLVVYYPVVTLFFVALIVLTFRLVLIFPMLLLLAVPRIVTWLHHRKRLENLDKQLPDALMMIAGALRSGSSLNAAFQQLASELPLPLSQEISLLAREQRLGVPMDEALTRLQERVPLNSVVLAATTIRVSHETGGELAEALSRMAGTLKQIAQAEGKIRALTAQGKMQAWVVGAMPLGLMLVLSNMEPEAMEQMWTTPAGWVSLGLLAILEFMGIFMILKIVNIDV